MPFVGLTVFGASVDIDDSFDWASFSCFSGAYLATNDSCYLRLGTTSVEVIVVQNGSHVAACI